jgi:hypothetical protein
MDPTTALMLARGSVLLTEKRDEGERGEDAVGMAAPLGDREGGRAPAGRDWWDGVGVSLGEREREWGHHWVRERERGVALDLMRRERVHA